MRDVLRLRGLLIHFCECVEFLGRLGGSFISDCSHGDHLQSPGREGSMRSLRSSSLTPFAPAVLASHVFALAAAPLSPTSHSTSPSPASSLAPSASLREPATPSRGAASRSPVATARRHAPPH
ncbi:hypothetical protein BN903_64 [Halorubrum sp. AJ67]|nr:hypothetical protein BN903_64 [Halorubrum sp. AJ67]